MAKIPKKLHGPINSAFPKNVCLVGTARKNGWAQITPKGSTLIYDDETIAYWDRKHGSTYETVQSGTKVMVYFRSPELRQEKILPKGGIARFYGTAIIYKDGPVREEVWKRMVQPERDHDPEQKGQAVLIKIERAEDLSGAPLES